MPDSILNIKMKKKFEDRIIDIYPITHGDVVLVGSPTNRTTLTNKLKTIDNTLGTTDFSSYTPDMSTGMKTLFETVLKLKNIIDSTKSGNIFIREHTFSPSDFIENSTTSKFEATITSSYIKETDIVNIYFESNSSDIADSCGFDTYYCLNGKLVVESKEKPTGDISFKYTLIKQVENSYIPESFRFYDCTTTTNADGSILKTYDFGTLLKRENDDGSITEIFTDMDGNTTTKITVTAEDGTVTETIQQ